VREKPSNKVKVQLRGGSGESDARLNQKLDLFQLQEVNVDELLNSIC
jgi:hypothetical protein